VSGGGAVRASPTGTEDRPLFLILQQMIKKNLFQPILGNLHPYSIFHLSPKIGIEIHSSSSKTAAVELAVHTISHQVKLHLLVFVFVDGFDLHVLDGRFDRICERYGGRREENFRF
jgi:hypothetical protein